MALCLLFKISGAVCLQDELLFFWFVLYHGVETFLDGQDLF